MNNPEIFHDCHGEYCLIPLTQGKFAKIEPADYISVAALKWGASKDRSGNYYAMHQVSRKIAGPRRIGMHNFIMRPETGMVVDHREHDTLDNRRGQLRIATQSQNRYNLRVLSSRNKSGFKGVHFAADRNRWIAKIVKDGKSVHLGSFLTAHDANDAYVKEARKLHGEYFRIPVERAIDAAMLAAQEPVDLPENATQEKP